MIIYQILQYNYYTYYIRNEWTILYTTRHIWANRLHIQRILLPRCGLMALTTRCRLDDMACIVFWGHIWPKLAIINLEICRNYVNINHVNIELSWLRLIILINPEPRNMIKKAGWKKHRACGRTIWPAAKERLALRDFVLFDVWALCHRFLIMKTSNINRYHPISGHHCQNIKQPSKTIK